MHIEVLAGRVTRAVLCMLCSAEIRIGEWAIYYPLPPRGSVHLGCHVRRARR